MSLSRGPRSGILSPSPSPLPPTPASSAIPPSEVTEYFTSPQHSLHLLGGQQLDVGKWVMLVENRARRNSYKSSEFSSNKP